MKLFLLLINIISIFNLTLANVNNVNNTVSDNNECQIYYSIVGRDNKRCRESSSFDDCAPNLGDCNSYANIKNGHIIEL